MNEDALLCALAEARRRRESADYEIRVLLAYAREMAAPVPYRLADLARASGMSVSGIRTAYGSDHIQHAARVLNFPDGEQSRDYRHITQAVNALLGSQNHIG